MDPKDKKNIMQIAPANVAGGAMERLFPQRAECSELTVSCHPDDYSAGSIARAVEDCNTHLLNLNLTADTTPQGHAVVELRIGMLDPSCVARSLERHGYTVRATRSPRESADESKARRRAEELMHYLSV